jgi:hypothetical protein
MMLPGMNDYSSLNRLFAMRAIKIAVEAAIAGQLFNSRILRRHSLP